MQIEFFPPKEPLNIDLPTYFLPSIDFEDLRAMAKTPGEYSNRVPYLVERLLRFFDDYQVKLTFFVVGGVAKANPTSVKDIIASGHEVGCHTFSHTVFSELTPPQLKVELQQNCEILQNLGANSIVGVRAPLFSLVEKTAWAWDVMKELGFTYSSSVLPAANPQFGWKGFNNGVTRLNNGLWELPMPITQTRLANIPFTGGAYIRLLPKSALGFLSRWYVKRQLPLVSYLHPYDIDVEQERYKVMDSAPFNFIMYYNRGSTLKSSVIS